MWKLLSQPSQNEPDLRAQLQPFQGCSPQQIQEQLQSLHIQGDPSNPAALSAGMATQQQQSDVESSLSSTSAVLESGQTSTSSGSSSSVASSSRKSSAGSCLMALLSPSSNAPVQPTQTQATPTSSGYSSPSADQMATLLPHRRYSQQDMAGSHASARQKRCACVCVCVCSQRL